MNVKSMLEGPDHIEYVVKDVEGFVEFFKMFGFEVFRRTDHHHGSVEMKLPGNDFIFEFHAKEGSENLGIEHISFATHDIDALAAELKAKKIDLDGPKFIPPTDRVIFNCKDPNGFKFQIASTEPVAIEKYKKLRARASDTKKFFERKP
jgi:catechol 2,3-dioxygenase-like lactoylglutathione lyase family enzyme